MNGFSDDIISILKHNLMCNSDSLGFIAGVSLQNKATELYTALTERKMVVASKRSKGVYYDYIVVPLEYVSVTNLLKSLTHLSTGGIIILETTNAKKDYEDKYLNRNTNFSATKLKYDERTYMIIHQGEDYGD